MAAQFPNTVTGKYEIFEICIESYLQNTEPKNTKSLILKNLFLTVYWKCAAV